MRREIIANTRSDAYEILLDGAVATHCCNRGEFVARQGMLPEELSLHGSPARVDSAFATSVATEVRRNARIRRLLSGATAVSLNAGIRVPMFNYESVRNRLRQRALRVWQQVGVDHEN